MIIKKMYRITSVFVTKSLILILNLQPDFGDKYASGFIENLGITKWINVRYTQSDLQNNTFR